MELAQRRLGAGLARLVSETDAEVQVALDAALDRVLGLWEWVVAAHGARRSPPLGANLGFQSVDLGFQALDAPSRFGMLAEPVPPGVHPLPQVVVDPDQRGVLSVKAGELGTGQALPALNCVRLPSPPQLRLGGGPAVLAPGRERRVHDGLGP